MTECNQSRFEFEVHFSRRAVAEFSGERLTNEDGSLLLRAADRKIGLFRRVVRCFTDARDPQRIYRLALGHEDLNDREELRNHPLLGMLAARRDLGAPLAGKSTLNQLELMPAGAPHAERYHNITYSAEALEALLVDLFVETHQRAPREIVVDLDARKRVFSTATTGTTAICRCTCSAEIICCARRLRPSNQDASAGNLDSLTDISDLIVL